MKHWPVLYVKTASGAIAYWQVWTVGSAIWMRWGQMGGQEQTSSTPAEGKNIGRSNETSAEDQAIKEAEARFTKQLRLKYVHSVEEAETGINIKPMRAYEFDEKRRAKMSFPVTLQPKFDGCRCMAYPNEDGSIRLMSRGGLDYVLPHVQEELRGQIPKGQCLDGELYVHGLSLQTIRHLIETPSEGSLRVQFVCYDFTALPVDTTSWQARQLNLISFFSRPNLQHVKKAESVFAHSLEEIDKWHDYWVDQGYEGLIVRLHDGVYKLAAKSTSLLKYKKFDDAEFLVVDWSLGKDGIIQYTCRQEEGRTFEARPMGTDQERATLLAAAKAGDAVGKKLTVRFMGRSDENIPLHPRGVAFRPDKDLDADE